LCGGESISSVAGMAASRLELFFTRVRKIKLYAWMGTCVAVAAVIEYWFQRQTSHDQALGGRTKKQVKALVRVFSRQVQVNKGQCKIAGRQGQ